MALGGGYWYYTREEVPTNKQNEEYDTKQLARETKASIQKDIGKLQDKAASAHDQGKNTAQQFVSDAESKASQLRSSAQQRAADAYNSYSTKVHQTYDSAAANANSVYDAYASKLAATEREAWNKLSNVEKDAAIKASEAKEKSKGWFGSMWPGSEQGKAKGDERTLWEVAKSKTQKTKDAPYPKDGSK